MNNEDERSRNIMHERTLRNLFGAMYLQGLTEFSLSSVVVVYLILNDSGSI